VANSIVPTKQNGEPAPAARSAAVPEQDGLQIGHFPSIYPAKI
jgi:hypothetical protein